MQEAKNKTYIRKKIVVVFFFMRRIADAVVCTAFVSDGI